MLKPFSNTTFERTVGRIRTLARYVLSFHWQKSTFDFERLQKVKLFLTSDSSTLTGGLRSPCRSFQAHGIFAVRECTDIPVSPRYEQPSATKLQQVKPFLAYHSPLSTHHACDYQRSDRWESHFFIRWNFRRFWDSHFDECPNHFWKFNCQCYSWGPN